MATTTSAGSRPAAIVTGGSSGIGRAIAHVLAGDGFDLTVVARRTAGLDTVAAELGELGAEVQTISAQLGEPDAVEQVVARHAERFGRLDVLVNNAGVGLGQDLADLSTSRVEVQLDVNLRAVIIAYREALPLLRRSVAAGGPALVVNTASLNAVDPQPWLSVYSAAKAGVAAFTQSMNKELGPEGIRSTVLCPGMVDTPMTTWLGDEVERDAMLRPEDLAEVVRMLLRVSRQCVIPEVQLRRPGGVF